MRVVSLNGLTLPIAGGFLAYVQRFDIMPQINPLFSPRAGSYPDPVSSMYVLKRAIRAGGVLMGDVVPLGQLRAHVNLVPKFGSKADLRLTKQNSFVYSDEFWLNKYFDKETFFALTPL
jgi:hypothetical protein